MAGKEIKVSSTYTQKSNSKLNAQWLRNATRSLGSNSLNVIKDISPNIYGVAESTVDVARIARSSKNKLNANTIAKAIDDNRYVKYGKRALSNALKDLKTGNFDNTSRSSNASDELDSTYHFGEVEDGDDSQIKTVVNFNPQGLTNINDSIVQQTKYQMQAAQANVDTMVATSSAMMAMNQKNATESLNMLSNINNSLQAIIKYNNENMNQFIKSSMTYYEMMGKIYTPKERKVDGTIRGTDIIDGEGKLNKANLRTKLGKNARSAWQNTMLGGALDVFESLSDQIISNPLGFLTTTLMSSAIPKSVKRSTKQLDKTFGNFVTEMLMKSSYKLRNSRGELGIGRFLGDILNIDVDRKEIFDLENRVTKDAAVFDGITRNAITSEIPKYLRESTAYLRQLVLLNGGDPKKALAGSQIFDRESGSYKRYDEFGKNLLGSIDKEVLRTMYGTDFGRSLSKVTDSDLFKTDSQREAYSKLLDKFFIALEKEQDYIDITKRGRGSDISRIINGVDGVGGITGDKMLKKILETSIYESFANGRNGMGINVARIHGKSARNRRIEDLEDMNLAELSGLVKEGQTIDEALASVVYGTDGKSTRVQNFSQTSLLGRLTTIEKILDRGINVQVVGTNGYKSIYKSGGNIPQEPSKNDATTSGNHNKEEDLNLTADQIANGVTEAMGSAESSEGKGKVQGGIINVQNHMSNIMHAMVRGDTPGMYSAMGAMFSSGALELGKRMNDSVLVPLKDTIFGTKDGKKDGKEYSITGKVKEMFNNLKDDMAEFVFGPKGEDGKRDKNKATVKSFIHDGLDSLTKSVFGDDKSYDEMKEKTVKWIQDNSETGLKGAVLGAGLGVASGGILGTIVGGPVAGALLGSATAILSKSKGFQKLVFGDQHDKLEDEDGTVYDVRRGGLISPETQKFFQKHKKDIIGGAGIGTIGGAITGGGLLGSLVGGPVAGALLGSAIGIAKNSKTFQEFVFGKEVEGKDGQKKKVGGILGAFNRAFYDVHPEEKRPGKEIAARSVAGAGGGLLLSLFTPLGPIGGAALGLAASMVSSKDKFHELLFGDPNDTNEETNKGLVNRIGAQISTTVIAPLANIVADFGTDVKDAVINRILDPIVELAEPLAGMARRLYEKVEEKVSGVFDGLKRTLFNAAKGMWNMFTGELQKLLHRGDDKDAKGTTAINRIASNVSGLMRASNERASLRKWNSMEFRQTREFSDMYQGLKDTWTSMPEEEKKKYGSFAKYEKTMGRQMFYNGGTTAEARRQSREARVAESKQAKMDKREATSRNALIARLTKGTYSSDSEEARAAALEAYKASRGYKSGRGTMGLSDDKVLSLLAATPSKPSDDATTKIETEQLNEMREQGNTLDAVLGTLAALATHWGVALPKGVMSIGSDVINRLDNRRMRKESKQADIQADVDTLRGNIGKITEYRNVFSDQLGEVTSDYSFDKLSGSELRHLKASKLKPGSPYRRMAIAILDPETSAFQRQSLVEQYRKMRAENRQNKQDKHDAHMAGFISAYRSAKEDIKGGYANGVKNATPGVHPVGEKGKELIRFNGGERVYSNDELIDVRLVSVEKNAAKTMNEHGEQKVILTGQNGLLATYGTTARLDSRTDNKSRIEQQLKDPKSLISYDLVKGDNDEINSGNARVDSDDEEVTAMADMIKSVFKDVANIGGVALGLTGLFKLIGSEGFQNFVNNFGEAVNDQNEKSAELDEINGYAGGVNRSTAIERTMDQFFHGRITGHDGKINSLGRSMFRGARQIAKAALFGISSPLDIIRHPWKTIGNIASNIAHPIKNSELLKQTDAFLNIGKNVNAGDFKGVQNAVADGVRSLTKEGKGLFGNIDIFKNFGKSQGDNIIDFASKKAAMKAGETVVKKGAKESTESITLKACRKILVEGFDKVGEVLGKRFKHLDTSNLSKTMTKHIDDLIELISKNLGGKFGGFIAERLAKLSAHVAGSTAVAATGVGLLGLAAKDAVWMTLGALNSSGKGGVARLFNCKQSEVNLRMRIIASTLAGLKEHTVGTVLDILNEISVACANKDYICAFASALYGCVASDEAEALLKESQKTLQMDFEKYKKDALKKEFNDWRYDGNGTKSLTFEQFVAKVENGELDVNVMGFDEYNDNTNKTHAAKIFGNANSRDIRLDNSKGISTYTYGGVNMTSPVSNYRPGGASTGAFGGRGFVPFYSQKDPRWGNIPYEQGGYGETMANAGCGPAAFAMAASGAGAKINPVQSALLMQRVGARDNTGTNWSGIGKAASRMGINSVMSRNPSMGFIDSQLAQGRPVILSGRSGGYGSTPFTPQGHYVVATGKDSNGNYIINDPNYMGGRARRYNKQDMVRETGAAWGFGGRGVAGEGNRAMDRKEYNQMIKNENSFVKWMDIVKAVKKAIADYKVGYNQQNYVNVTIGGKTVKTRTDCSGYVCTCLEFYGIKNPGYLQFNNMVNNVLIQGGLTPFKFQSFEELQEGDIVAAPGHVMIYAGVNNGIRYYYNCGSTESNNSAIPTSFQKFTPAYVWRVGNPGSGVITDISIGEMGATTTTSNNATSTGTSGGVMGVIGKIGSFFSELGNRALSGLFSGSFNTDWSGFFNGLNGGTTTSSDTSSYVSTGVVPTAAKGVATGGNLERALFAKLTSREYGLTKAGAAGLMGNLHAESGLRTNNMQNDYEGPLGMNDTLYTTMVDNGTYKNFINDRVGYGLAQWTSADRKKALLELARKRGMSISNEAIQTEHLLNELRTGYRGVYNVLSTTDNVREASDAVLHHFEKPEVQTTAVEVDRASRGKAYFDKYGGEGGYGVGATFSNINYNRNTPIRRSSGGKGSDNTEIIAYLSRILEVLGESTDKLDALRYLKNISDTGGFGGSYNSVNVNNNSYHSTQKQTSAPAMNIPKTDASKYATAQKIARGGL